MSGPKVSAPLPPIGGMTSSLRVSARKKKGAYKVLGDFSEFEEKLAQTTIPPTPPEPDTIRNVDPMEFPEEIWNAATISPDFGAAIIRAYREVASSRSSYRQQLDTIHHGRSLKNLQHSTASLASLAPVNTTKTGRTIADVIRDGKDPRKLDNFARFSTAWDSITEDLARKTQRPGFDLAMERGAEWRLRQENAELLERAVPITERRAGEQVFVMGLRNNWEFAVPVGTTGLRSIIRDSPSDGMPETLFRMGRPLEPQVDWLTASKTMSGTRSLTMRGRDWQQSEWLKTRQAQNAKGLVKLMPIEPDVNNMALHGEALEAQLETLAFNPITLPEVEQHLASMDPEAYAAYQEVKYAMEEERLASEAAEIAAHEAEEAALRAAGPQPGGVVELSPERALLSVQAGESSSTKFTLTHKGTVALQYTWRRQPPKQPPFANTDPDTPSAFYMTKQSGTLLPGYSEDFHVGFKAQVAGTYTETWVLSASPALAGEQEVSICLRGVAIPEDSSSIARAKLDAELAAEEKMRKVRAAVERVLEDIPVQAPPPVVESLEEKEENLAFDAANARAPSTVYYNPHDFSVLRDTYASALEMLHLVQLGNNPPVVEEKKKLPPTKKGAPEEVAPPPPPPKFPDDWDLTVASVQELLKDLSAELEVMRERVSAKLEVPAPAAGAKPTEVAAHQSTMAAAKKEAVSQKTMAASVEEMRTVVDASAEAMRVPPDNKRLMRHAIRGMMLRIAESVDQKLEGIKEDYQKRLAAQKAAAEAAGEAGAGPALSRTGTPLTGGRQVDDSWYLEKCKVGTKAVLKSCVPWQWEELAREKGLVGNVLESRIKAIDAQVAQGGEQQEVLDQKYWDRFALLREWVRLDIPPRGDFIH